MKKINKIEIWFLISSISLFLILLVGVGFAFKFVSSILLEVFSTAPVESQPLRFDIEGYDKLGI